MDASRLVGMMLEWESSSEEVGVSMSADIGCSAAVSAQI